MIKRFNSASENFDSSLQSLLSSTDEPDSSVVEVVSKVIADIRTRGDEALLEYTNQFDRRTATLEALEISRSELDEALSRISDDLRQSLEHAAKRVRDFHEKQKQTTWTYEDDDGNVLGQKGIKPELKIFQILNGLCIKMRK